jgi:hypothetical protein
MYSLKRAGIILGTTLFIGLSGCQKESTATANDQPAGLTGFIKYTIPKGQQYATSNSFVSLNISEWRVKVYFDSSAIYTLPGKDQFDINKLTGFADNAGLHQQYSARFGWRWSDNRLRLFAYVHNSGQIQEKEISAVDIGKIYTCSIKVTGAQYIFTVEELKTTVTMPRAATTLTAEGYRLYPYFGGNNTAPHEIRIWIKYL